MSKKKSTEPFEIEFDDLTKNAQARYLEWVGGDMDDVCQGPLAILETPEEE